MKTAGHSTCGGSRLSTSNTSEAESGICPNGVAPLRRADMQAPGDYRGQRHMRDNWVSPGQTIRKRRLERQGRVVFANFTGQ
jgi:hypothetical protein